MAEPPIWLEDFEEAVSLAADILPDQKDRKRFKAYAAHITRRVLGVEASAAHYQPWREARAEGSFAAWLDAQMAEAFLTSSYLASCLGCSAAAVNTWRKARGFPSALYRERIAAFFGTSIKKLPGLPPAMSISPRPKTPERKPFDELKGIVFR